jgi:MFS family permease
VTATDLRESERWIVRNGVGIQVMETLAVGAFLTALAVELGASNAVIGVLAAIPHLAQLAQIPALYAVERVRDRKRVYRVSGWVARPMLLVIALAAWLAPPQLALLLIVAAFAVRYVAGAFLSCAWNSWMRDLVPGGDMGRLFGRRQKYMIGIGVAFSLVAAGFVDLWKNYAPLPVTLGYGVVYVLAFIGGAYSVVCANRIHEPPMVPVPHESLVSKLLKPLREQNYRRLIVFLASWNFATNLAAPFFVVLMLRRMQLDLLFVIGLATLSQLAAWFTVTSWGAIADRFSNKAVLAVCGPMFVLAIFAWTFTTMPDPHAFTVPLLIAIHIATGIAAAGVNLATGNIALKLAPPGDATAYLASNSMINALAAGCAALFGGVTADVLASWELDLTIRWHDETKELAFEALNFSHWDFFFFLATVIGLYSLHRLSLVEEHGEVHEARVLDVLLKSMHQGLRNLSTVAGLRGGSDFPVDLVDAPARDDGKLNPPR